MGDHMYVPSAPRSTPSTRPGRRKLPSAGQSICDDLSNSLAVAKSEHRFRPLTLVCCKPMQAACALTEASGGVEVASQVARNLKGNLRVYG